MDLDFDGWVVSLEGNFLLNYDSVYYKNVTDKVFLLSTKELYNNVYKNGLEWRAYPTKHAQEKYYLFNDYIKFDGYWEYWLMTPNTACNSSVRIVTKDGMVGYSDAAGIIINGSMLSGGVRPALYIESGVTTSGLGTENEPYMVALKKQNKNTIKIVFQIGNPYMTVNGVKKEIDPGRGTKPQLYNNRTILPIKTLIEAIGGTVGWDGAEQKVTVQLGSKKIELWINKKIIKVNGEEKEIDVAPQIINSRTMVPIRFISENLGLNVTWDEKTKKITINN